ncbi:MAG: phosphoribosylformylglycinamidine cyclo-ligase [Gammaproteobacteria bacterium AqS3]|nr:phosphoribosylformylglycinamidine cyclo-ligase [Gammaproteobacteria bacterium AqS3]
MTSAKKIGSSAYREAGVDTDRAAEFTARITSRISGSGAAVHQPGGFCSGFRLPAGYEEPVLVSGADGVGTKLRLAIDHDRHGDIGQDLVAMCVNDILTSGAEPLFFLDYFATAALDPRVGEAVVEGIARACETAGCPLLGGETAEMPGFYRDGDYDLAGFAVGVVEHSRMRSREHSRIGDALIALPSSGVHSNGYSLVRKILAGQSAPVRELALPDGRALLDALLTPTRLYTDPVRALVETTGVHAFAHITGGGLHENIPRALGPDQDAALDASTWTLPEIFSWIQSAGGLQLDELHRVFNCGIGMIAVLPEAECERALRVLADSGLPGCWCIGTVVSGSGAVHIS